MRDFSIARMARGAASVAALCLSSFLSAQQYTITDLGGLGGTKTRATGINQSGQITGFSEDSAGRRHAFRWVEGTMTSLPGLPGRGQSVGEDIDDAGVVIGTSYRILPENGGRATTWSGTTPTNLGTLGGSMSMGFAINDAGKGVGLSSSSRGVRATLFTATGPVDIGQGLRSRANDLTNGEVAVGRIEIARFRVRARRWEAGEWFDLGFQVASEAFSINELGVICGNFFDGGPNSRVFLWQNGTFTGLSRADYLRAGCYAINHGQEIVGWLKNSRQLPHAALWRAGVPLDLNDVLPVGSDWFLAEAIDVNDAGMIVGYGLRNGEEHAFLLTPSRPLLLGPAPGVAGESNTLEVRQVTPNAPIVLYLGQEPGSLPIAGCPGLTIQMGAPAVAVAGVSDGAGRAVFQVNIPLGDSGELFRLQAADPGACRVTNLTIHRFP